MLSKIKDNLGLIATAIALMGSIGAGLSTATEIVDTLKGIDNRMNQVEVDFEEWDDIKIQITRLETQLMDQDQDLNVVREIQTRLAWIEANCCR